MEKPSRPKALVVFFSRTGATRGVAEAIAHAAGGDLEELKELKSRLGLLGWLRSGYEGTYRLASDPLPLHHDPADYDIVFVGSPTWNKALSSPVRGFLQRHGARLPRVALFATCAGHGADQVVEQMLALVPQPAMAKLTFNEVELSSAPAMAVGAFVEAALLAWEQGLAESSLPQAAQRRASG